MAISFDDFKQIIKTKSPEYINISDNTVTLKQGYYLFNKNIIFPKYPDDFMLINSHVFNRTDIGRARGSGAYDISLPYTNINSDIVTYMPFMSMSLSILDSGAKILWYTVRNVESANQNDFFGYREDIGWNEPRARAMYIKSDITQTYADDSSSLDILLFNICIFLMKDTNIEYYSFNNPPNDPGGDLSIRKTVTDDRGIEITNTENFEFNIKINGILTTNSPLNLKNGQSTIIYDFSNEDVFEVTEVGDGTGRYQIKKDNLIEKFGEDNVIENAPSLTVRSNFNAGEQIEVEFVNIDKEAPPPIEQANLIITKEVISDIEADKEIPFPFKVTISDDVQEFTLKHTEQKLLEGYNVGEEYTIEEKEVSDFLGITKNGIIQSGGTTVKFINKRTEPQPIEPTITVEKLVKDEFSSTRELFNFDIAIEGLEDNKKSFYLSNGQSRTFTAEDFKLSSLKGTSIVITETYFSNDYIPETNPVIVNIIDKPINVTFWNNRKTIPPSPPAIFRNTVISGLGEKEERINEITPDDVATFRNFALGYNADIRNIGGVMDIADHNFYAEKISPTTVRITDGICFAYGYVGYCLGREIDFFPPAVEQYQIIYAEIDRSVIPNKISIKTKNNQSSSNILLNTFRQDVLSVIKTGKFQVPLWLVRLSNNGIEELISKRPLRKYIDNAVYSDNTSRISGTIAANVTVEGDMKPLDTNDKTIATTEWAKAVIEQEIRR